MTTPALRLTAQFKDTLSLAHAWMPFIRGGALFVPTTARPALGESAFVLVSLDFSGQRHAVTGQVVWLSALNPPSGVPVGVGIQFGQDETAQKLASQIADSLGNIQSSLKKTSTL